MTTVTLRVLGRLDLIYSQPCDPPLLHQQYGFAELQKGESRFLVVMQDD